MSPKGLVKGLVVAAPRSGSGKTTLTLGLMRALKRRGVAVAGAKCGPDYIDPAFHAVASGRASVNLDSWAMPERLLRSLATTAGSSADIVICEGLMGLFDGVPGEQGQSGASADIAALTGWPVLLVLDVSGQSTTAAAIVKGFMSYDPRIRLGGVVLNRVGSERHRRLVREAIEALGVPVLGSLPRSEAVSLPERHLGLVQAAETSGLEAMLEAMADFVEAHVDVDGVVAVADAAHGAPAQPPSLTASCVALPPPGRRIALARDAAFSFIYPHVLQGWMAAGAEIIPFSPLADEAPPDGCDICWLPGGYPELHAGRLAAAHGFLDGLRHFARTKPVHGECGGYMVLGITLVDAGGDSHAMAGLLSVATSFAKRKMQLGYRDARLLADGPLGQAGTRLKGHEFHYSTLLDPGTDEPFALVGDAYGSAPQPAGARRGLVSASFFHAIARQE
ncbi:hydrogenobyrinic acid a,c-diamide synthase (glutamine-hydrolysing) /cobyrinate a,c-diamide synthase [Rhizobiales bacterium GAS191]|nr:hydrogenobyrinic acid a,c-diamide synthase (glutamine-hydrolysing) /cobyrinate a,c-diamide synthase [Rhizobiales bacterium GAS191]